MRSYLIPAAAAVTSDARVFERSSLTAPNSACCPNCALAMSRFDASARRSRRPRRMCECVTLPPKDLARSPVIMMTRGFAVAVAEVENSNGFWRCGVTMRIELRS